MQSELEKLGELIDDVQIAMVTTVAADGALHTRPLATLENDDNSQLWFFTSLDSEKVDEIEEDARVSAAYSNPSKHVYVVVSGTAEILKDRKKAEELWTPLLKAWFPEGLDDPELALLRIDVDRAEYWTSPGKAAFLLGAAKASITGHRTKMGENHKLAL